MTEYSRNDLDELARREARYYVKTYKYQPTRAKLKTWKLIISDSGSVTLAISLEAYDGIRQINVSI
jgi:hypothetical protein